MPSDEENRAQSVILTNVFKKLDTRNKETKLAATYSDISQPKSPIVEADQSLLSSSSLLNNNFFSAEETVFANQQGHRPSSRFSASGRRKMSRSSSTNSRGQARASRKRGVRALSPEVLFDRPRAERVSFSNEPSSKIQCSDKPLPDDPREMSTVLGNSGKHAAGCPPSVARKRLRTLPPRKTGVPGSPFMSQQHGTSAFAHCVSPSASNFPSSEVKPLSSEKKTNTIPRPPSAIEGSNKSNPQGKNILSKRKASLLPPSSQARPVSLPEDPNYNQNATMRGLPDLDGTSKPKEILSPHTASAQEPGKPSEKVKENGMPFGVPQASERVASRNGISGSPNLPSFSNPFLLPPSYSKKESDGAKNENFPPADKSLGNSREKPSRASSTLERPVAMSPRSMTRRASVLVDTGSDIPISVENNDYFHINLEKLPEWKYKVNRIEWIQVPVLFDLFTYLIQFHELQEAALREDADISMLEEALSCLISRISFSMLQVDGILLNSLFTKWENKNHEELFRGLVASWRKGVSSLEFKEASVKVLHAISTNDVSDVSFTKMYRAWRWCSSFLNYKLTLGVTCTLAFIIIGLSIALFLGSNFPAGAQGALLSLIVLLTLCLLFWSTMIASHNFYADAASTFFRENARSSVPLDAYFNGGDEEEEEPEIPTPLSEGAKTTTVLTTSARRRNSSSFLSNTHAGMAGGPLGGNPTTSQYSFLSVLSTSANRGDDPYRFKSPENGTDESCVLHQLQMNTPPSGVAPLDKPGGKFSHGVNNRGGTGVANNDNADVPNFSCSPYKAPMGNQSMRSRPVVKVGSNNTDGSFSTALKHWKSIEGSPTPHEEKRLKRSESKKYLFSRSLTGPGGTSSVQSSLVAALVLIPTHLSTSTDEDKSQSVSSNSKATTATEDVPLLTQSQFNSFTSSLESRGFTVLKYTNIGNLDEGFHQGVHKSNIILLPNELWVFNTAMRAVVVRWLTVEFRSIFFFSAGAKSQDSKSNASSSCPSLCGSPLFTGNAGGSLTGTISGRSRGGFSEIADLNVTAEDPFPPPPLCVYIPLGETMKNKLYDSAGDRAQSKKAIFHSYVPPYSLGQRLGGGAFASVFSAVLDETGTRCAVKRIQLRGGNMEEDESDNLLHAAVEEVELLSTVFHPNIVRYMYTERTGNTLSIFMERCGGGTLHSLLSNVANNTGPPLTAARVKRMLTEIMSAVAFLHVKLIIHRDLKPENILFHEDGTVRLVDFGSAGLRKDNFAKIEGTLAYMAPEVLLEMPYGKECDIWSVGCVAADIFGVEIPQKNMGLVELHEFFSSMKDAPDFLCEEEGVRRFLLKCLRKDPTKRVQCIDLLQDEILTSSSTAVEKCLEKSLERRQNMVKRKGSSHFLGSLPSDSNMSLWSIQI